MLSKKFRFHNSGAVRYVLKNGKSVKSNDLALKYLVGRNHDEYRAAVVVSKKVAKSAPTRNRIRRRVYEALRNSKVNIRSDADLIVSCYDIRFKSMKWEEMVSELDALLKKAELEESAIPDTSPSQL